MKKAGVFSMLALAGALLAQESSRDTAVDSMVAAGAELAALISHGYEALDAEARGALTSNVAYSSVTFRGMDRVPALLVDADPQDIGWARHRFSLLV